MVQREQRRFQKFMLHLQSMGKGSIAWCVEKDSEVVPPGTDVGRESGGTGTVIRDSLPMPATCQRGVVQVNTVID